MIFWLLACTPEPETFESSDDPVPWQVPACPDLDEPMSQGTLGNNNINEASGIARSYFYDDLFWVHNDSGDSARIFAVGLDGEDVGTWKVAGATAVDWEDMAAGLAGELVMADIGDNDEARANVTLYTVMEPADASLGGEVSAEKQVLRYPDGAHNAETLLVDPLTGDRYIVTKVTSAGKSTVFRVDDDKTEMTEVDRITFGGASGSPSTTGGDVSADGKWVVIETYTHAFAWPRDPAEPLHTAFEHARCRMPRAEEPQGEAITWTNDGGLLSVSEGTGEPMYLAMPR